MSSLEPLSEELSKILNIIADLAEYNTATNVYDHAIISRANLSPIEVNKYINELRSKGLIIEVFPKPDGISFTLYRITREGLDKLENQDPLMFI
ncbi:MAG TPA: winged helix-turn-helix domain-containing protein [Nitrososphaeraceae archaeon]|nr:winged helix-turn-helix domain-containing protein [Nitrososphaeraceae archaeon]